MDFSRLLSQYRRYLPVCAALLLALCLLLSALSLGLAVSARRQNDALAELEAAHHRTLSARLATAQTTERSDRAYLLRIYEDKIGVYYADGLVLLEQLDVNVSTLPSADRAKLAAGITVYGEAALRAICEDYTS